jgi:diguanylate cyclase (GGDEF)-like protein
MPPRTSPSPSAVHAYPLPPARLAESDQGGAEASARRRSRRHAQQLRMLGAVFASYLLDSLLLALLHLQGVVRGEAVLVYAAGGSALCGLFFAVFRAHWNERFSNPYLTVPQVFASAALQLLVAWRAPEVALLLVMILFIVFAFAALEMRTRVLLAMWAGCSLAVGAVLSSLEAPPTIPAATPGQLYLSCLWIALVIGRCAFVGVYGARVRQQLGTRNRELADARDRLHDLATHDALTGALNRGAIMEQLEQLLARGHRPAAVLIDLDHFKLVNDRHGHLAGDQVLRRFVVLAAQSLRGHDRLGRYGGEEFLLVLPEVGDAVAARTVAERVREALAKGDWSDIAPGLAVTASLGVACAREGENTEDMLRRADLALYDAKHAGRNIVR